VGKPEESKLFGSPRYKQDYNIKMGVQEIEWEVRIGVIWLCRVTNGGLL